MTKNKKLVIAGASGFIGKKLIDKLLTETDFEIIAISRHPKTSHDPRLEWRVADLFSLLEVEKATADASVAIYLVHSMLPTANLDQGEFEDFDLILADNFARAMENNKIQQVIYLGGLRPEENNPSKHLKSRLEMEEVFKNRKFSYTFLRAGLIIGAGGSSFNMMVNIVKRLPILVCPKWTLNLTSIAYVEDILDSIKKVIHDPQHMNKSYDVGTSQILSYYELLSILSKKLNLIRFFIVFPLNIIFVSRFWVRLFSGAGKELVYPLLDSLKHTLIIKPERMLKLDHPHTTYQEALDKVLPKLENQIIYSPAHHRDLHVRSIQRIKLPEGKTSQDMANNYMKWLPIFLNPFLKVIIENGKVNFCLLSKKINLLELTLSKERSSTWRVLFYITGGLLSQRTPKGRLEFRETLDRKYFIVAIHDFYPALPWYIYKYTQALVHLFVMRHFKKYIESTRELA